MRHIDAVGPNAEQITCWNEVYGPKWVALHEMIDAQITPLGHLTMDRAGIGRDQRVLDIGCGCGATSLEMARRVGPNGEVVGIDVSSVMLGRAQSAAEVAAIHNVRFENADAQTYPFDGAAFDLLFSRFGVMFFNDPEAAFRNLRGALLPGGRLAFVCWRPLQDNPWMFVPLMAAAQHVELPPPPPPRSPGPFAFAEADYISSFLPAAGFVDLDLVDVDHDLAIAGDAGVLAAAELMMEMGPAAAALREADPAVRPRVLEAIKAALEPYMTPAGVRMPSAARIVTARRPA
ncbi:class I SAM-dependent methyltransferase [Candidatus Binatia bacterium]|nr:class I SAM-dependent methyltransferase [Candidatus Binatia bacterium]